MPSKTTSPGLVSSAVIPCCILLDCFIKWTSVLKVWGHQEICFRSWLLIWAKMLVQSQAVCNIIVPVLIQAVSCCLALFISDFFLLFLQSFRDKQTQSLRITSLVLLTFLNRTSLLNQQVSGSKYHRHRTCHLVWSTWTRSWIFPNARIALFSSETLVSWGMELFGFFLGGRQVEMERSFFYSILLWNKERGTDKPFLHCCCPYL